MAIVPDRFSRFYDTEYGIKNTQKPSPKANPNTESTAPSAPAVNSDASVSEIESYRQKVNAQLTTVTASIQSLSGAMGRLKMPSAPVEDLYKDEDGNLDEEAFDAAKEQYKKDTEIYNNTMSSMMKSFYELQGKKTVLENTLKQLDDIEGETVPENLKTQAEEALGRQAVLTISEVEDIKGANAEIQSYIDKFNSQKASLVAEAAGFNQSITNLSGVSFPELSKYINPDGTIDVSGYKSAVQNFKNAQEQIIALITQLEEKKAQIDSIDGLLNELREAKTVEDFELNNADKIKLLELGDTAVVDTTETRGGNIEELDDEQIQNQINTINTELEKSLKDIADIGERRTAISERLAVLDSEVTALSNEFTDAFNNPPKLSQFESGGIPNVAAYNSAVEDYNNKQAERLRQIEEKINEATDLEDENKSLEEKLTHLSGKIESLEKRLDSLKQEYEAKLEENKNKTTEAINNIINAIEGGSYGAINGLMSFTSKGVEISASASDGGYALSVKFADGDIDTTISLPADETVNSILLNTNLISEEDIVVGSTRGSNEQKGLDEDAFKALDGKLFNSGIDLIDVLDGTPVQSSITEMFGSFNHEYAIEEKLYSEDYDVTITVYLVNNELLNKHKETLQKLDGNEYTSMEDLEKIVEDMGVEINPVKEENGIKEYSVGNVLLGYVTIKVKEASDDSHNPETPGVSEPQEQEITADATGLLDPLSFSSLDELKQAISDKTVNLRYTSCDGVFCQLRNPDKKSGDYTEQKHYVWNDAKNCLEEVSDVYYINANGTNKSGSTINNAALQAKLQGYNFTTTEGVYKNGDNYYIYDAETNKFVETEAPKPEETDVSGEGLSPEDNTDPDSIIYNTQQEIRDAVDKILNENKEEMMVDFNLNDDEWNRLVSGVYDAIVDRDSLTENDIYDIIGYVYAEVVASSDGSTENDNTDPDSIIYNTQQEIRDAVDKILNEDKEDMMLSLNIKDDEWNSLVSGVYNAIGDRCPLSEQDIYDIIGYVYAEVVASNDGSTENAGTRGGLNIELDTTQQTFANPGETHNFINNTLNEAKDSLCQYYKENTGLDDFESVWSTILGPIHEKFGNKESLSQEDVVNAAKAALDEVITAAEDEKTKRINNTKNSLSCLIQNIESNYHALNGLKEYEKMGVQFSIVREDDKYIVDIAYEEGDINETINIDATDEVAEFLTSNGFTVGTRAVFRTRGAEEIIDEFGGGIVPDVKPSIIIQEDTGKAEISYKSTNGDGSTSYVTIVVDGNGLVSRTVTTTGQNTSNIIIEIYERQPNGEVVLVKYENEPKGDNNTSGTGDQTEETQTFPTYIEYNGIIYVKGQDANKDTIYMNPQTLDILPEDAYNMIKSQISNNPEANNNSSVNEPKEKQDNNSKPTIVAVNINSKDHTNTIEYSDGTIETQIFNMQSDGNLVLAEIVRSYKNGNKITTTWTGTNQVVTTERPNGTSTEEYTSPNGDILIVEKKDGHITTQTEVKHLPGGIVETTTEYISGENKGEKTFTRDYGNGRKETDVYDKDGHITDKVYTQPDGTKKTEHSDGSRDIEQTIGNTGVKVYTHIDKDGTETFKAIDKNGKDITKEVYAEAMGQVIIALAHNGAYGTGPNFDRQGFLKDLIQYGHYEKVDLDNLSTQQIYDIVTQNKGASYGELEQKLIEANKQAKEKEKEKEKSTNNSNDPHNGGHGGGYTGPNYNPNTASGNPNSNVVRDMGSAWVDDGFGGYRESFSQSDLYSFDFNGNMIQGGMTNNWGHGGGGGSVAHY